MKIAYIFSTLSKTGGTERMIVEKANYFADEFDYDVTIINCLQQATDVNHFVVSSKVKQINLGIPYFSQYKYKYPKRLWIKWQMNKQIKNSIKQYVQKIDPDILIGISFFKANLVSTVRCRAIKIIESHEARQFTHSGFGLKRNIFSKIDHKLWRFNYFKTIERNADAIITLTEGDKSQWKQTKYSEVIPNFSTMTVTRYSECTSKRIIAVGRLEWEKGFGRLINAWAIVSSKHPDWHLDIYGEGSLRESLKNLISIYRVKNVILRHATSDISREYATSSICAITSFYEGFSLILLEAMKHGVPCVAFDCPFGPRSIINDGYNGFLVDNSDIRQFAERLCRLIEDEELRKQFSKNAIVTANTYDVNIIMNQWKDLFEHLILH